MTSLYNKLINVECKFTQYYSAGEDSFIWHEARLSVTKQV